MNSLLEELCVYDKTGERKKKKVACHGGIKHIFLMRNDLHFVLTAHGRSHERHLTPFPNLHYFSATELGLYNLLRVDRSPLGKIYEAMLL